MEEIWSNRTYVALALFSLLATCVVFWSHQRRDIGYTAVIFFPESVQGDPDLESFQSPYFSFAKVHFPTSPQA
jgi:hypothetical protein